MQTRPCVINEKKYVVRETEQGKRGALEEIPEYAATWHRFFQFSDGDEEGVIALVELADGAMYEVNPSALKFTDK